MAIGHGNPAGGVFAFYSPNNVVPNSIDLTYYIISAPFYVPSPGYDTIWYAQPVSTAPTLDAIPLTHYQKYFANLNYDYRIDVYSRPNQQQLTQVGLLANLLIDYVKVGIDNIGTWVNNSIDVPQTILVFLQNTPNPFIPSQWKNAFDSSEVWNRNPIYVPQILTAVPFEPKQSNSVFDNQAVWSNQPAVVPPTLGIVPKAPFVSNQLNDNNFDSISVWNSQPIVVPSTLGVVPKAPFVTGQPSFTFGDLAVWYRQPANVPKTLGIVTGTPFFADQPNDYFENPIIWNSQPIDIPQILATINVAVIPSIVCAPFYVPKQDEITTWQWQPPNPSAVSLELYQRGNDYFYFPVPDFFSVWLAQSIDLPQVLTIVPPVSTVGDIPVAPFYVPSPTVETYWRMWKQRVNISVAVVISPFEIDQLSFNSSDVPSSWYAQPRAIPQAITAPPKALSPFHANSISFNSNEVASVWSGGPITVSKVLGIVNSYMPVGSFYGPRQDDTVCWYGQYFGVSQMLAQPPPVIAPFYVDATLWYAKPIRTNELIVIVPPFDTSNIIPMAPFYVPRQDEITTWQWQPPNPSAVSLELYQRGNDYFYFPVPDFFSTWLAKPLSIPTQFTFVPPVSTLGDIPVAPFYVPSPLAESYWLKTYSYSFSFIPNSSAQLNPGAFSNFADYNDFWKPSVQRGLSFAFTPFIADQPSFASDDPAVWRGAPILSKVFPMLTAAGQVKSHQWLFGYDDPSYWTGKPLNSAPPIPMLTIGGIIKAKQWHWDNDDPSMWAGWINRNLANETTLFVPPNIFAPIFYRYNDPDIWRQPSQRSVALPFLPVVVDHRDFSSDDPPPWEQPSQRSIALPFVPAIVDRWRIDPIDDLPWSFTVQRNISPLSQPFSTHWRLDLADDQLWSPINQRDLVITVTPLSNRQAASVLVDYVWQSVGQQRSRLYFFKPELPAFWNFNNDDAALSWHPATQRSLGVSVFLPQYPPFIIRQPSFAHDDHSSYQWLVRSSLILSLRWDISYRRIATTIVERNRVIDVLSENRISITITENRIVDAIDEED